MLISQKRLCQVLGLLWLIDGLLQLQPHMFTADMAKNVMVPTVQGQPAPIASSLQWFVQVTTHSSILINLIIVMIQIIIGIWLLSGRGIKGAVIVSCVWALIVWYAGEGMSMLLTGQASVLSGAPGAVLLYLLLGLAIYPRRSSSLTSSRDSSEERHQEGLLSRLQLRWIFAGFWFFAALLQLQPYWWQSGQISQTMKEIVGQGGLNGFLIDPVLQFLSRITSTIEIPLNIVLIVVFLGLGITLTVLKEDRVRPFLVASIVVSLVIWYATEVLGGILTISGQTTVTDFNSGLLLVVIALACWPTAHTGILAQRGKFSKEDAPKEKLPLTESA